MGAFGNPLFSGDCGAEFAVLGVSLNLIPPVKLPASSLVFHPAGLNQVSPIFVPIVHFLPSGALGFAGATQSG